MLDVSRSAVSFSPPPLLQDIEVKEVRKMLNDCMRDLAAVQKKVAILEGEIEQQRHERHQILKSCKVSLVHACVHVSQGQSM